ncbi:MAG: VWA domain-containing protein [Acidobacteriota bacterium]
MSLALNAQQRPTFRAAIEAVQVDVLVTDGAGRAVSGLTADDFELLENGKPQAITTFSAVDIPIDRGELPLAEPDVRTNDGPEGRIYLIALDEVGTHPDRPDTPLRARAFLRRFIEDYFGPNDLAAVVLTGRGLSDAGQDFTSNRRLLLNAIDTFSGGFRQEEQPAESQNGSVNAQREREYLVRNRMASLRALAEFMVKTPGRRKAMLFVSEGIGFNMFDVVDYAGGVLSLAGEDARAAMSAATRGNLAIYPIDPLGLGDGGTLEARSDLAALAHVTGGFALSNSENFDGAFTRMVRDNSAYYVLGFNSAYEKRDGRYVRLEVRTKRPGLTVKSRDGYVAPIGKAPAPAAAPPRSAFAEAIASPFATGGLPIRVFAAPYKGVGRNAAIVLAVEVDAAQLGLVEANGLFTGQMDVGFVATDARKKITRGPRHTAGFALKPETYQRLMDNGMRVVLQAELPEGRYQLRVAAGSAARAGNVVYDLEVPDFTKAPLFLSGVTLTSSTAAATLTRRVGADPIGDGLPGPPTAARTFAPGETLALYAEVYDNSRSRAVHAILMTTELRDDAGRVVRTVSEQHASTDPQRKSGGYGFAPQVPLGDVAPGRYLLHIEARSGAGGKPVTRDIPVRVAAPR